MWPGIPVADGRWSGRLGKPARSAPRAASAIGRGTTAESLASTTIVVIGGRSVRRSRRAVTVRVVPAGVRAADRVRPAEPVVLAPLRPRRPGGDAGRGPGPAAHGGDRGARRGLDPAARPARRGVRAAGRRTTLGLPVEPAGAGGRGGARGPRRRAAGARRRVRAAGAGRAGPGGRSRTGAPAPGCSSTARRASTSRSPPGACRCAGSSSSTWRSGSSCSSRTGGCCATAPRSPRPAGGPTGRCRCCAGRSATCPITEAVEEATRWLEEFHPRSVVELDYGGLVELLPDDELAEDDSPALVATRADRIVEGRRRRGHGGVRGAGRAVAGNSALRAL